MTVNPGKIIRDVDGPRSHALFNLINSGSNKGSQMGAPPVTVVLRTAEPMALG